VSPSGTARDRYINNCHRPIRLPAVASPSKTSKARFSSATLG
jgi:hypothetical protein